MDIKLAFQIVLTIWNPDWISEYISILVEARQKLNFCTRMGREDIRDAGSLQEPTVVTVV